MGNSQPSGPYSYAVPNTGGNGESPHYRARECLTLAKGELVTNIWPDITTCHEGFMRSVKDFPKNPCFGTRKLLADRKTRGEYVWETYNSVFNRVRDIASALKSLGFPKHSNIGVYSINRPEWLIATHACYAQTYVSVPLYDTLGPDAVAYVLNQAEIPLVVCSGDKLEKFKDIKAPSLKYIVSMDPIGDKIEIDGVEIFFWDDFLRIGAEKKIGFDPAKSDDLATICYTSGTTGDPKGVMLTHKNFISMIAGALGAGINVTPSDVYISYLPLAHMYERLLAETLLCCGSSIGFFSGEILKLLDDVVVLRPTFFPSVPRLFNRMYDRINTAVRQQGGISASIFEAGVKSKKDNLKSSGPESFFWDTIVFRKTKEKLGGRVRMIFTGSAPLQSDVHDFLKITMCCPVLQGYGLTETCAVSNVQRAGDNSSGTVGPPVPCTEVKLVDVPDMNYLTSSSPPQGEICLRGPNLFVGYYKMQDKTDEVLEKDGWFHTGDIGQMNPDGTLQIIDRKKNIFKLSQGEYVAAEKIENVYSTCPWLQQIFVYGDSTQNVLVAIVVPDPEKIKAWASENQIPNSDDVAALYKNEQVKKMIINEMTKEGKHAKLRGFEFVKNIHLEQELFSVENGLLTPSFKLKRPQLKDRYKKVIDELYVEANNAPRQPERSSEEVSRPTASPAVTNAPPKDAKVQESPKVEQPKEEEVPKPAEEEKTLVEESKPVEEEKPAEENKPEEVKPVEEEKPAEENKAEEVAAVEEEIPTEEVKTVEEEKPVEEVLPAEGINDSASAEDQTNKEEPVSE